MRFLALDFDGVISDSIRECLVVGNNAWNDYSGSGNTVKSIEALPTQTVQHARRMRNFIRSGEDYVYIFMALSRQLPVRNQEEFDLLTTKHATLRQPFFDYFYRHRKRFLQNHKKEWIRLNPLYEGMQRFLQHVPPLQCFIITTKKTSYVDVILKANSIDFIDTHLFHADKENPKAAMIKKLLRRYHIAENDFYFVDDQVDTLIKCKATAVCCILAEWGYNNSDQITRAKQEEIKTLSLPQFYLQFGSASNFASQ